MPEKRHTKEQITHTLSNLADRLGKHTLTQNDVKKYLSGQLPLSSIKNYFGNLGNALEASGLKRGEPNRFKSEKVLSDDDLFRSFLVVEQQLGHEPGHNEYNAHGMYSIQPFRKRFGKWEDVLSHYRKWKADNPNVGITQDRSKVQDPRKEKISSLSFIADTSPPSQPAKVYGEPIDFRGLRHAPTNEQGVVYLFGMISKELGFMIEAIGTGYPDCEAKYWIDQKRKQMAPARIEFEFKASNFREHGHATSLCDFIVCWENDWPDCPVKVIELSKEILKLSSK